VDYPTAQGSELLRKADEVVHRGVRIPSGQVRCTTCHDARSPWKDHVSLPPGSTVFRAIDLRDRSSYEGPPRPARPGDAVSVKPLCFACHALD
jgi:hypothetical protein